jgi:hypothetical protein
MFYYRDMLRQNLTPTDNTLHQLLELCRLLFICSARSSNFLLSSAHRRVSEATVFFEEMKRRWGVRPTKLNYQLLVDLLRKENRLQVLGRVKVVLGPSYVCNPCAAGPQVFARAGSCRLRAQ